MDKVTALLETLHWEPKSEIVAAATVKINTERYGKGQFRGRQDGKQAGLCTEYLDCTGRKLAV